MGGETLSPGVSTPRGPLDPADLQDFVEELRQAGYNIGVNEYIAAQDLVLALTAHNPDLIQPQRLKSLLGPLLCSTPTEQEDFGLRYDAWLRRLGVEEHRLEPPTLPAIQLEDELKRLRRRSLRLGILLISLVLGLIAVIVLVGLWVDSLDRRRPTPQAYATAVPTSFATRAQTSTAARLATGAAEQLPTSAPAIITAQPTRAPLPAQRRPFINFAFLDRITDYLPWIVLLVGGILLWLARKLWWDRQARLFLERLPTSQSPELANIQVSTGGEALFPTLLFLRLAQGFRQRVEVPSSQLDIISTIDNTVHQGGWFTPAFSTRHIPAEYLVLIERKHPSDQQARFMTEMISRLREHQVFIEAYYFDGDPRLCFPMSGGAPRSLWEIVSHHAKHRLIIFSDAAGLFNHRTGELENWASLFKPFMQRAIFTPEPRPLWGKNEEALQEMFQLLPSTPEGLARFVKILQGAEQKNQLPGELTAPLPEDLRTRTRRWLGRDSPPDDEVDAMLEGLKQYLDPAGYMWLCACAIYPELHWELTVYLGDNLLDSNGEKLLQPRRLVDLARLPWLRASYMPDWLRSRLISSLSPKDEKEVRIVLEALLLTAIQGTPGGLELQVARQHDRPVHRLVAPLLRRFSKGAPDESALQDFTFMNFMSGKKPNSLAVQAPEALRQLLNPSNWRALVAPGALATSYGPAAPAKPNWRLFGSWVGANFLAGLLSFGLTYYWITNLSNLENTWSIILGIASLLSTLLVPVFQWRVLRMNINMRTLWILFSLLMVYPLVSLALLILGVPAETLLIIAFVVGAVMGFLEWFLLGYKVSRSWVWIPASILGCLAAVYSSVFGYALITGLALVWLERRKLTPPSGSLAGIVAPVSAPAGPAAPAKQTPAPAGVSKVAQPASWYIIWIFAGIAISTAAALIVPRLFPDIISNPLSNFMLGAVFGAILGVFQWLMLRRYGISPFFILASAIGLSIGFGVCFSYLKITTNLTSWFITNVRGLVIGVPFAFAQWIFLRSKMPRSYIWLISVIPAWMTGTSLASTINARASIEAIKISLGFNLNQMWVGLIILCSGVFTVLFTAAALRYAQKIEEFVMAMGRLLRDRMFYILLGLSVVLGVIYWFLIPTLRSNIYLATIPIAIYFSLAAYGFFQRRWAAFSGYLTSAFVLYIIADPIRTGPTFTSQLSWTDVSLVFLTALAVELLMVLQERIHTTNHTTEILTKWAAILVGLIIIDLGRYLVVSVSYSINRGVFTLLNYPLIVLLWYLATPVFYLIGVGLRRLAPAVAAGGAPIPAAASSTAAAQSKMKPPLAQPVAANWYASWIIVIFATSSLAGWLFGLIVESTIPIWLQMTSFVLATFLLFLVQWLLLRKYGIGPIWILASITGIGAGIGIIAVVLNTTGFTSSSTLLTGAAVGIFLGAGISLAQWLVLRRKFQKANLWLPSAFLGWFIGLTIGAVLSASTTSSGLIGFYIMGIPGLTSSLATALAWHSIQAAPGIASASSQVKGAQPTTTGKRIGDALTLILGLIILLFQGIYNLLRNRTFQIYLLICIPVGLALWGITRLLGLSYVLAVGLSFLVGILYTEFRYQPWGAFATALICSATIFILESIFGSDQVTFGIILAAVIIAALAELLRYLLRRLTIKNRIFVILLTVVLAVAIFIGILSVMWPMFVSVQATRVPTPKSTTPPAEATAAPTAAPMPTDTPPPFNPTPTSPARQEAIPTPGPLSSTSTINPTLNAQNSPSPGDTTVSSIDNMVMVWVDAFWIDQTEVTNGMYKQCVQAGACPPPLDNAANNIKEYYGEPSYDNYPVIKIDYYAAVEYCKWTGRQLPDQQQWQFAAFGADSRPFSVGEKADCNNANINICYGDPTAVGSFPAGAFGIYDMTGNVYEWTATQQESNMVVMGGSWNDPADAARNDAVTSRTPESQSSKLGFRCINLQLEVNHGG